MSQGSTLPVVTFHTRVRDESIGGDNPFRWEDVQSDALFGSESNPRRVVLFSLPGAFTPTCSTFQLPGFENNAQAFKDAGIDDIYCVSVNDTFVMNAWGRGQKLENVKVVPDGTGEFTDKMGMLVDKSNIGFGKRSWRYAAVIKNGVVEQWFEEPGKCDNHGEDPYGVSSPETVLEYLTK
ncbi:redoxin family protein [Litorivicinus lipolyticus]|uniref:Glutathione-dependent peroxiredoxin n=1 Tax=Litorivicinus lipolyticus TaxID=418701 RepID=A0A5Q2Q783_9GAMM|nr:peroxiredoxin [Litorivicinus lipolyticus]QGG80279.1 redoxin family protein [Litorivicinus lipolyticus]